ncbi:MAG: AbrB/MazE/SpoVT family DNA-binding domain-containing protein, partial [Oscillatoria sp. PMC 1068.18]|nr:AbrB/MazE/SpoVT family DNA-binding domain-containing protein [Oscillatoria sp. PMC 1068.18]
AITVGKWGNSLAIRIPENIAQEINLGDGSEVNLSIVEGNLVIEPKKRKRYSLDELVEGITPENLHAEVDSGVAVGNEVW